MNDSSIHALGNGHLCAYGQGTDLIQVFGPPYSSPAFYTLRLKPDSHTHIYSHREPGTAIWTHQLSQNGSTVAVLLDFVDAELPCLARTIQSTAPLRFTLTVQPPATALQNTLRMQEIGAQGGLLLQAPAGVYFYHVYPFPWPIVHQLAWRGPIEAQSGALENTFELTCMPGEATLYIASAGQYPFTMQAIEAACRVPVETLVERTRRFWASYAARRIDIESQLSPNLPHREALLNAADSVATLIIAQQSAQGAILAGHNYHMGYVRDQYGAARGLMALGHYAEARRILEFYWDVWQRHGKIHNAQAIGLDGVFHIHENDRVEITGYLILQAFDLLAATGDDEFLHIIFPMLDWAFTAQKSELANGMLPFNGDETYIAGGILPRSAINDGSAEATLLFLESGAKLLTWARQNKKWDDRILEENGRILEQTRRLYRQNFWREDKLLANNPQRLASFQPPRFRHGVCERCSDEGTVRGIEWTERNASGRYLCPRCSARGPYPPAPPTIYELLSVSLTPIYFHSNLFTLDELRPVIERIVRLYETHGRLPSRPDDPRNITVGYDYGLLLYALAELMHPLSHQLFEKTLSLLDSAGAWVEYYINHQPSGTRCRPWESAINIEALLHFAQLLHPRLGK